MVVPLVVLAVGAALVGFLGLPGGLLRPSRVEPARARAASRSLGPELEVPHSTEWLFMGASTLLAVIGIAPGGGLLRGGYQEPARRFAAAFPGFVRLVAGQVPRRRALRHAASSARSSAVSRGLFRFVDRIIIDKILVEGTACSSTCSRGSRAPCQGGDGQRYMAVFAVGVALLVHFATPADAAVHQAEGHADGPRRRGRRAPRPAAPRPAPLEYAFDFGDGRPVVKGTAARAAPRLRHARQLHDPA